MRQYQTGYISDGNCTRTPLGIEETFTGTEELTAHHDLMVVIKTDAAGTLYVDLGVEPGVYDTSIPFDVAAGAGDFHTVVKGSRYCRIRLVNGSSAQTYLRLQTEFGSFRQPNQALNSSIQNDADASAVRPTDYSYEVALGRRTGASLWNKFGFNEDVDTAAPEIVADFGGAYTRLTAASTLTIVSSSSSDADGGVGAHGLVIYGVDGDWNQQVDVVFLNGTTNVVSTSTWLGISRISVFRAGTSEENVGDITVTATTGGSTQATMPAGEGTSQQLLYFVSANATALITSIRLNVARFNSGTEPIVTFKLWVFSDVSNAKYEVFRENVNAEVQNVIDVRLNQPLVIGEKSVVWVEAATTQNNTSCSGRFSLIEVQD